MRSALPLSVLSALLLGACCSLPRQDQLSVLDLASASSVKRIVIMPVFNPVTMHYDDPCYKGALAEGFPIAAFYQTGKAMPELEFVDLDKTCAALKRHGYRPYPDHFGWKDYMWTPTSSGLSIPESLAVGRDLGADAVLISAANINDAGHRTALCQTAVSYGASWRLLDARTGKTLWGRHVSEPCNLLHFLSSPMGRSHYRHIFSDAFGRYRSELGSNRGASLPSIVAVVPVENQTVMPEATWVAQSQLNNRLMSLGYLAVIVSTEAVAGRTPAEAARALGVDGFFYAGIESITTSSVSLLAERQTIALSAKLTDSSGKTLWSGRGSGFQDGFKSTLAHIGQATPTPLTAVTDVLDWSIRRYGLQLTPPIHMAMDEMNIPLWPGAAPPQ